MMTTTKKATSARATKAAVTRAANKEKEARMAQIMKALTYEISELNVAINKGKEVILPTAFGSYVVDGVDGNHWYYTHPQGTNRSEFNSRSFAGCNDGKWADLLQQAGVTRHPLFAKYT